MSRSRASCRNMRWKCGQVTLAGLMLKRIAAFVRDRNGRRHVQARQRIVQYIRSLAAYARELDGPADPAWAAAPPLTVVLNSFRRPENMPWLVAGFLRLPYVSRIIVLNNNPLAALSEHLDETDPRLEMRNLRNHLPPAARFHAAANIDSQYFASADDDLFLRPSQIHKLFSKLQAMPTVPHGILGERIVPGATLALQRIFPRRDDMPVDVLLRVYFFSRSLLDRYAELETWVKSRGFAVDYCDDALLSFSGHGCPRVHDTGPWVNCLSSGNSRVALFRTVGGFQEQRVLLFKELWEHTKRESCWRAEPDIEPRLATEAAL
jgi:hypothetical protein